jgi:hypothetical protein
LRGAVSALNPLVGRACETFAFHGSEDAPGTPVSSAWSARSARTASRAAGRRTALQRGATHAGVGQVLRRVLRAGELDAKAGHPWLVCGPAFASRAGKLTAVRVRAR